MRWRFRIEGHQIAGSFGRRALSRLAATLLCCAIFVGAAHAQVRPEIDVRLVTAEDATHVEVGVRGLLADRRVLNAMESGFPLYVEYQVALRNARSGWFDGTDEELTFEYVVFFDPVRELYVVEARGVTELLSSLTDLRARVAQRYRIEVLQPDEPGRYYYSATMSARTLSDSDVDEVFAWLKGEQSDSTALQRPGLVTRTARRLLVRVAPLPRITLEERTEDFIWP